MKNNAITEYWLKYYCEDHCTLCGNSGFVDTTATARTATGLCVGRQNFCICPNGQALRRGFRTAARKEKVHV